MAGSAPTWAKVVLVFSDLFYIQPIKRRKALAPDGRRPAGQMNVAADHLQASVPQVLLEQENVAPVDQEQGGIGMPEQVRIEPVYPGGFGQPLDHQRRPAGGQGAGQEEGI